MHALRRCLLSLALLVLAGSSSRAADLPDAHAILESLADPARHAAALAALRQIPESALVPVIQAADDPATPAAVRKELAAELPAICARLKAAWVERWEKETASNITDAAAEYQKFGRKDPKWDALVAAGLKALDANDPNWTQRMQAALDAGCTDPLVVYLFAKNALQQGTLDKDKALPLLDRAAREISATDYPADRKLFANLRFFGFSDQTWQPGNAASDRQEDALHWATILFGDAVRQPMSHLDIDDAADALYAGAVDFFGAGNRKKAFDLVYPAISQALPDNSITCAIAAEFYVDWAWDARGTGGAASVSPANMGLFHDRILQARDAAEKGWRLNPLDPRSAILRIKISMALGLPRDDMETWYRRSLLADPDSRAARTAKWNYLLPQWFGSRDEVLAFGRQCVEEGNYQNRVPCTLLDIHLRFAAMADDADAYWQQPEVWNDLKLVYARMLPATRMKDDPDGALYDRAWYLHYACQCHQWKDFQDLLAQYGAAFDLHEFGGQARLDFFKQKAADALTPK